MKSVCVPCARFYRCVQVGYVFIEGMPLGCKAQPGKATPELWKPYKIWVGDLYECPGCGAQTIHGIGERPVAEHYMLDFAETMARRKPQLTVNDC